MCLCEGKHRGLPRETSSPTHLETFLDLKLRRFLFTGGTVLYDSKQ